MRVTSFRKLVTFLALSCSFSPLAFAAEQPVSFYPAKEWVVSEASDSCQIRNEYNNGYILDFFATNAGFTSMDLDFRQSVFTQGDMYDVTINIPGVMMDTLTASAQSDQVLSLDISGQSDFYKSLGRGGALDLSVEGNDFRFYMTGLGKQINTLNECVAPMVAVADLPAQNPEIAAVKPADVTTPAEDNLDVQALLKREPVAAAPVQEQSQPAVMNMSSPQPVINRTVARATMDISDINAPPAETPVRKPLISEQELVSMQDNTRAMQEQNAAFIESIKQASLGANSGSFDLSSPDWNLEKATMRFQEAERQLKMLGQKLQRERVQCEMEQKELESMLFDPQLTNERQLATLSTLEEELQKAQEKAIAQRIRYEEQIKILREQASGL